MAEHDIERRKGVGNEGDSEGDRSIRRKGKRNPERGGGQKRIERKYEMVEQDIERRGGVGNEGGKRED